MVSHCVFLQKISLRDGFYLLIYGSCTYLLVYLEEDGLVLILVASDVTYDALFLCYVLLIATFEVA